MDGIRVDRLPNEWTLTPLGNICELGGGTQPPKSTFKNSPQAGYIRLLQIRDFESDDYAIYIPESKSLRIVKTDDISIARYGASIGRILSGKAGAINVAIMTTFPDETKIIKLFLRFILQMNDFQRYIKGLGGRAAQAGFNKGELQKFYFPLPPLLEQQRIAYVLLMVQTAIEQQVRLIKLTRELKSALMHKLFTEGLHGEKQKMTEIGPVPESWGVAELGSVSEKPQYGFTETAKDEGTVQFLRITDIQDFGVTWTSVPFCACPDNLIEKYLLKSGDVVFARIGATTGKSFVIENPPKAVFASYLIRIRPQLKKLDSAFLGFFCQSKQYWQQIDAHKGNNLKGGVNSGILQNLLIPLPDLKEQQEIASVLMSLENKINAAQKKRILLEELFRTLLHQLMTGQTRVNAIDLPGFS